MLNELYLVSQAMERVRIVPPSRHPRIKPMGKNRELLIVRLNDDAKPSEVEFVPGDTAARLFRVEHGSSGSSFPGLNIPTPLRRLDPTSARLSRVLERLCGLWKDRNPPTGQIHSALTEMVEISQPRPFTTLQCKQFRRSVVDLVHELQGKFCMATPGLSNFTRLLDLAGRTELSLDRFSRNLTDTFLHTATTADHKTLDLIQQGLFGVLDWKKRINEPGSDAYRLEKTKQDKNANQPVYFDVVNIDLNHKPVAHPDTSKAINDVMLRHDALGPHSCQGELDAFGNQGPLEDKYPTPKVAKLGDVKLFSVNTTEIKALHRYGLKGSHQFSASTRVVQKMNDALLYLGDEKRAEGVTWRGIPGNLATNGSNRNDLLIAYLEEAPDFQEELAALFGGGEQTFGDSDFDERTQRVLNALEGKLHAEPSLKVRLLSLCAIDKGRKQVSLHRQFSVQDIIRAAREWKTGAANTPPVSIWFHNKKGKKTDWKSHFVPHPLDLTSAINRVWRSDAKTGFNSSFQRVVTTSDAYDVFFFDGPISRNKTCLCFSLLLHRTSPVLVGLGRVKASGSWKDLSDHVRWHCRKTISLIGIFLQQLGHSKDRFMQDSTYQMGRLLALADGLHFQYCKWVRTSDQKRETGHVDAPSELLGNSLFHFALDNPLSALARLAERIRPYKGWADTYSGKSAGLIQWFLRQMGECERHIDVAQLPERMEDVHKAQLLLGYLADHPKTETEA